MRWLVALLMTASLAGCAADAPFDDSTHRWSGSSEGDFQESHEVQMPSGIHTLRITAHGDGFAFQAIGPDGAGHGFNHAFMSDIDRLEYTTERQTAGTWNVTIGCLGACSYVVALDVGANVPQAKLSSSPLDTASHVAGSLMDDDATATFTVTSEPESLAIVNNLQVDGALRWQVYDGSGQLVSMWNFDDISARDWRYQPSLAAAEPGEWRIELQCTGTCAYNIGVADRV